MVDNVINLDKATTGQVPPDNVLEGAKGKLKEVIVIGYFDDDSEYYATSMGSNADNVYLLERFKKYLLLSEYEVE